MQIQIPVKLLGAALLSLLISACGGGSSSQLDDIPVSSQKSSSRSSSSISNSSAAVSNASSVSSSVDPTTPQKIGNGSGDSFTEGVIAIGTGTNPVAAGGSVSLIVNIVDGTNALASSNISVTFASPCVTNSQATFVGGTGGVVTATNGQATITYQPNGCVGNDLVTARATLNGAARTAQITLTVSPDTVQTIKFIDAQPEKIFLKGSGQTETSLVRFQAIGATGEPLKDAVMTFSLGNPLGGSQLTNLTATTDSTGHASTTVQSGTVPSSVEVTASIGGVSATSKSLIISTGLPVQNNMSLSASLFNPSGWNHDGEVSNITIRLADDFNNPVADGTAVYFTAEGGSIGSNCTTVEGTCTVAWRSQDSRPSDGRVTILATTQGNENFIDRDGDGLYDPTKDLFSSTTTGGNCALNVPKPSEFPADPVNNPTPCDDLGEAYVDRNENGQYDIGEQIVDQNLNGLYTPSNGIYNGTRCKTEGTGCTKNSVTIRKHLLLIMSSDRPYSEDGLLPGQPEEIELGAGESTSFTVVLSDIHGNSMPAGTTVSLITTGASNVTISHTMPSGGVANTTNPTAFTVTLKASDNNAPSGVFAIAVKSPYLETTYSTLITAPSTPVTIPEFIGKGVGNSFAEGEIDVGIGSATLAAGGSTTLSVNLVDADNALTNTPVPVTFSSACITAGTALLTSNNTATDTVTSQNGTASITYTAFGCVGTDLITATPDYPDLSTATASINIASVSVQSIEFDSATPEQIGLKGTGNNETSVVQFSVIGSDGPVSGVSVTLAVNTSVGGLCLTSNTGCVGSITAVSDANGIVSATIQSGSIPTSVRVTATAGTISTQSSRLVVSTGIPDQNSMSLSTSNFNPLGWETDGTEVTLTIRMADAFNNPPPDGTTVTFTAEGGVIGSNCATEDGACTVTWKSQAPRPSNGKVRILATALGNESFIDTNGNGYYDKESYDDENENGIYDDGEDFVDEDGNDSYTADIFNTNIEPFTDADDDGVYDVGETYIDVDGSGDYSNGESCQRNTPLSTAASEDDSDEPCDDLVEAYLDKNDNGTHNVGEEITDYNQDAQHTKGNKIYNGVLCNIGLGTHCTKTGVSVRDDILIVLSSRNPQTSGGRLVGQPGNIVLSANQTTSFVVTLADINGNSMPEGTKISLSTTNVSNATVTHNMPSAGVPDTAEPVTFTVTVKASAGLVDPSGSFEINVEAPGLTSSFLTTLNF